MSKQLMTSSSQSNLQSNIVSQVVSQVQPLISQTVGSGLSGAARLQATLAPPAHCPATARYAKKRAEMGKV